MKKFGFLFILMIAFAINTEAQKSPKTNVKGSAAGADIEIDYCAPSVKGRTIWGGLEKYGKVWRAGANENTTVSFSTNVKIGGKELAAGKYGFFMIPKESGPWTVIFSTKNDAWGSYSYKESEDALRIEIRPSFTKANHEVLEYSVEDHTIEFAWEHATISIPVSKK